MRYSCDTDTHTCHTNRCAYCSTWRATTRRRASLSTKSMRSVRLGEGPMSTRPRAASSLSSSSRSSRFPKAHPLPESSRPPFLPPSSFLPPSFLLPSSSLTCAQQERPGARSLPQTRAGWGGKHKTPLELPRLQAARRSAGEHGRAARTAWRVPGQRAVRVTRDALLSRFTRQPYSVHNPCMRAGAR